MFYFGKHYTVSRTATGDAEFACKACHFRSAVKLVATGQGVGVSPYFLANEQAKHEAHRAAVEATDEELSRLAEFIPLAACPRCGRRDVRFVADFWGRAVLLAILSVVAFAAVGHYLPMIDPGPEEGAWFLAKVGATIAVAYIGQTHLRRWLAVKRGLYFVPAGEEQGDESAT